MTGEVKQTCKPMKNIKNPKHHLMKPHKEDTP